MRRETNPEGTGPYPMLPLDERLEFMYYMRDVIRLAYTPTDDLSRARSVMGPLAWSGVRGWPGNGSPAKGERVGLSSPRLSVLEAPSPQI